jgi:hypothetical protein
MIWENSSVALFRKNLPRRLFSLTVTVLRAHLPTAFGRCWRISTAVSCAAPSDRRERLLNGALAPAGGDIRGVPSAVRAIIAVSISISVVRGGVAVTSGVARRGAALSTASAVMAVGIAAAPPRRGRARRRQCQWLLYEP